MPISWRLVRHIKIDVFNSNEEAIAEARRRPRAPSGYDMVVPTGVYIPQMVKNDLLERARPQP